jgi:hypothetical protein
MIKLKRHAKNLTGQRFGRLTALAPVRLDRDKSGRSLIVWSCRCDCGSDTETRAANLVHGQTRSCGCLYRESIGTRTRTHGHTAGRERSPEYNVWKGIRVRCSNPKDFSYPWYGARGIKVHPSWDSFETFLADVGPRPSPDHTIERIDVNGHYEPGNVTWIPRLAQGANKRNNRMITAFGETLHLEEWCRRTGIHRATLRDRLANGWDAERALSTPAVNKSMITAFGETMHKQAWSRRTGIPHATINNRLAKGWDAERALSTPSQRARK